MARAAAASQAAAADAAQAAAVGAAQVAAAGAAQAAQAPPAEAPAAKAPAGARTQVPFQVPAVAQVAAAVAAPAVATAAAPVPVEPPGSPGAGWWIASDGNWYPPELHPDVREQLAGTSAANASPTDWGPAEGLASRYLGDEREFLTGRVTMGGPVSAAPRASTTETDFFVMKSRRSAKKVKTQTTSARPKLAIFTFILVLVLVLGGAAAVILTLHH